MQMSGRPTGCDLVRKQAPLSSARVRAPGVPLRASCSKVGAKRASKLRLWDKETAQHTLAGAPLHRSVCLSVRPADWLAGWRAHDSLRPERRRRGPKVAAEGAERKQCERGFAGGDILLAN